MVCAKSGGVQLGTWVVILQIKEFSRPGHWSNGYKGLISRFLPKVVSWSKTRENIDPVSMFDWLDYGLCKKWWSAARHLGGDPAG